MDPDSLPPALIEEQITKDPSKSKKWVMSVIGLSSVLFVWIVSIIVGVYNPEIVAQIVSLATIVITFLGALTGAYVSGQSFVDWKNSSTLAVMDTNTRDVKIVEETKKEEKVEIHLTEELKVHIEEEGRNAPAMKPFGMDAVGDANVELGKEAEYDFTRN